MIAFVWFVLCLGAVGLLLTALSLYIKARNRYLQDVIYNRLALQDGDEPAIRQLDDEISNPLLRGISRRLTQAGIEQSQGAILTGLLAMALLGLGLAWILGLVLAALVMASLILIAHLILLQRSASRHKTLTLQLPDFMDRLLRPLIAGNSIEESFAIATRESPEPIRGLFLGVARQVRFGAPLEDALTHIAEVHELPDVHALAMASRVHRRYGGSIRNMVKSLMNMARSRETAAQELRALTAETRLSAWLLVAIPVAITTFILVRNPGYYNAMWGTSGGRAVLIAGFILQLIGALVIWRMMRSTAEARI